MLDIFFMPLFIMKQGNGAAYLKGSQVNQSLERQPASFSVSEMTSAEVNLLQKTYYI